jgi:hypothetical protein
MLWGVAGGVCGWWRGALVDVQGMATHVPGLAALLQIGAGLASFVEGFVHGLVCIGCALLDLV